MTPWIIAHQAPQSMELSRQEYWSGLSFLSPGDLPNPGTEPSSPALQADSLQSELYFHNSLKYLENQLVLCFLFLPVCLFSMESAKVFQSFIEDCSFKVSFFFFFGVS